MPTNAVILANAPIAAVLAGNRIAKGSLFGPPVDTQLDQKIHSTYKVIKKIYDLDPDYPNMTVYCQYLWELTGPYGIRAMAYTGGGGVVPGPTPVQNYPIYITQANFTTSTLYPNTRLFGTNTAVFLNQINRYLLQGTEYNIDAIGLNITLDGFDASQYSYELVIEKVYT